MTDKIYAISLSVKRKDDGICRYKSVVFKGISAGKNSQEAIKKTVDLVMDSINSTARPSAADFTISAQDIKINSCKPFNDFLIGLNN